MKARDSGGSLGGSFGEVGGVSSPHISFLCILCFKRWIMGLFIFFFGFVYVVWTRSFGFYVFCVFVDLSRFLIK